MSKIAWSLRHSRQTLQRGALLGLFVLAACGAETRPGPAQVIGDVPTPASTTVAPSPGTSIAVQATVASTPTSAPTTVASPTLPAPTSTTPPSPSPTTAPIATETTTPPSPTSTSQLPTPTTAPANTPTAAAPAARTVNIPPEILPPSSSVKEARAARLSAKPNDEYLVALLAFPNNALPPGEVQQQVWIWHRPGRGASWTHFYSYPGDYEASAGLTMTVAELKGDGTQQVLITSLRSGTGGFLSYRLIGADGSGAKPVIHLGIDDLGKGDARVVGTTIEQRAAVYAPSDPSCCPTATELTVYAWKGGAFTVTKKELLKNR